MNIFPNQQTHCFFTPTPVAKPKTYHPNNCLAIVDGMFTLNQQNYFTYTCHCGKKYVKKAQSNPNYA